MEQITPRSLGYRFPAEWEQHASTWLSYPHNEASWPDKIDPIFPHYNQFIKEISKGEIVNINVVDKMMLQIVRQQLIENGTDITNIRFHLFPTNDAWCRDHGPAFLVNRDAKDKKVIVNWGYNAWGGKYPHDLDNKIPNLIAKELKVPTYNPGIIMEGGSVDFNGKGTLITTTACLTHENRNPLLSQSQIEKYLIEYYGVEQVLWLGDGIEGDDTNGHVDDITRFVNEDTVVTVVEPNKDDANHKPLLDNLNALKTMRLINGKQLNIVELPMPDEVNWDDQRLPASYANFYACNAAVIVPTFQCDNDRIALDILGQCFTDRPVIGIDSTDIIWGLGSFHCLSQQEPI
jgi:agmatine deiminase